MDLIAQICKTQQDLSTKYDTSDKSKIKENWPRLPKDYCDTDLRKVPVPWFQPEKNLQGSTD